MPSAAELGGLAVVVAIGGGVAAVAGALWRGVRGFLRDRREDKLARSLGPGMRQRMYRLRAWRHGLSDAERSKWRAEGTVGRELRDFTAQPAGPSWLLEEQLLDRDTHGPALHSHEAIWMLSAADGRWKLVEAKLDAGASRLAVPPALARQLGYVDARGRPRLGPGAGGVKQQAPGPEGAAAGQHMGLVSYSIAGQRFGSPATLLPDGPKAAQCVLVPAQTIEQLRLRGVRFEP